MKNCKINNYYDAQEYYDELTLAAKQEAQQGNDELIVDMIEALFPHVDTQEVLTIIKGKMDTFEAIAHQYKIDVQTGGQRYKDILLIAMAEIFIELRPYEQLVRHMYPEKNRFFTSLSQWYDDYRGNGSSGVL